MNDLIDAQKMAVEHPDTFYAPDMTDLYYLQIGDYAKVCNGKERFWTQVMEVKDGKVKAKVANNLLDNSKYDMDDIIFYELRHIYNILKA